MTLKGITYAILATVARCVTGAGLVEIAQCIVYPATTLRDITTVGLRKVQRYVTKLGMALTAPLIVSLGMTPSATIVVMPPMEARYVTCIGMDLTALHFARRKTTTKGITRVRRTPAKNCVWKVGKEKRVFKVSVLSRECFPFLIIDHPVNPENAGRKCLDKMTRKNVAKWIS